MARRGAREYLERAAKAAARRGGGNRRTHSGPLLALEGRLPRKRRKGKKSNDPAGLSPRRLREHVAVRLGFVPPRAPHVVSEAGAGAGSLRSGRPPGGGVGTSSDVELQGVALSGGAVRGPGRDGRRRGKGKLRLQPDVVARLPVAVGAVGAVAVPTSAAPRSMARTWAARAASMENRPLPGGIPLPAPDGRDPIGEAQATAKAKAAQLAVAEKAALYDAHVVSRCRRLNPDEDGATDLHRAARLGYAAGLASLLDGDDLQPSDVNAQLRSNGFTALHEACVHGQEACARSLVAHPLCVATLMDDAGCTPLWRAAYRGHDAVVHALLDEGGGAVLASLPWPSVGPLPFTGLLPPGDFGDLTAAQAARSVGNTRLAGFIDRADRLHRLGDKAAKPLSGASSPASTGEDGALPPIRPIYNGRVAVKVMSGAEAAAAERASPIRLLKHASVKSMREIVDTLRQRAGPTENGEEALRAGKSGRRRAPVAVEPAVPAPTLESVTQAMFKESMMRLLQQHDPGAAVRQRKNARGAERDTSPLTEEARAEGDVGAPRVTVARARPEADGNATGVGVIASRDPSCRPMVSGSPTDELVQMSMPDSAPWTPATSGRPVPLPPEYGMDGSPSEGPPPDRGTWGPLAAPSPRYDRINSWSTAQASRIAAARGQQRSDNREPARRGRPVRRGIVRA